MSSVTIKSYRPQVDKKLIDTIWNNMERVGITVQNQAKKNTMHPMPSGIPNHPWETTGQLANSIIHFVYADGTNKIGVDIGTNLAKGKYLELGTVSMPPYPWLLPAVEEKRDEITKILGTPYSVSGDVKFD